MRGAALLLLLLAGCSGRDADAPPDATPASRRLDQAAIRSGQLPDADAASPVGAYTADTDIGEDRLCVIGSGERVSVGLSVSYGSGGSCVARGTGEPVADGLRLSLGEGCELVTRLDGSRAVFPGTVPAGCRSLCSGRASLAGVTIPKRSDSTAEASALTDARGRPLCPPSA